MLVGLVTKNTILVVDFTNTLRKEGNSMLKSLLTAVNLRLRLKNHKNVISIKAKLGSSGLRNSLVKKGDGDRDIFLNSGLICI